MGLAPWCKNEVWETQHAWARVTGRQRWGFDRNLMPNFLPDMPQRLDLDSLGGFIKNIAAAGMPLFPDEELEAFIRDAAGFPLIEDMTPAEREETIQDRPGRGMNGKGSSTGDQPDAGSDVGKRVSQNKFLLSDPTILRAAIMGAVAKRILTVRGKAK